MTAVTHLTTAMVSNAGSNFVNASGGITGTNITGTIYSNGLSLSVAAPGAGGGAALQGSGTYTQNTGTIQFSNANGVSFGLTAGTMTASYNSTQFQLTGNYLTTAMLSNAGSNFMGLNSALTANGVSMTANSSGLSLNFPAFLTTAMQSASSSNFAKTGFTTTSVAGAVVAGTMDTAGLKLAVPAYLTTAQPVGAYLTTAMLSNAVTLSNINVSGGTTSSNLSAFNFVNSNGVSWSLDTGSKVYATVKTDYLTTAMASNAGSNFVAASAAFAGTNASGTIGSNGISVSVAAPGAAAENNWVTLGGNVAGNSSASGSTIQWIGGNNITLSGLNNSQIRIDGAAGGGVTPAIQGSNGSFSFSTVTFGSSNNIHFYTTNGSVVASYADPDGVSAVGNTVGTNTFALSNGTFYLSGGNGITLSGNGSTLGINANTNPDFWSIQGNTLGASNTYAWTNDGLYLAGGNNITLSQNGSTLTIVGGGGGAGNATVSVLDFTPIGQFSSSQQTNSQVSFRYFQVPQDVSFSRLDIPMNLSIASTTTANTANVVFTSGAVLYTRNGSTLNPIVGAMGTTTYTWASNTANYSSVIGGRYASFPIGTSLSPGEYYLGVLLSTTNNASIGTATTQLANTVSVFVGSYLTAQNFAEFGNITSASTTGLYPIQGLCSVNMTGTAQTYQWSQISQSGAPGMRANIFFRFRNQ